MYDQPLPFRSGMGDHKYGDREHPGVHSWHAQVSIVVVRLRRYLVWQMNIPYIDRRQMASAWHHVGSSRRPYHTR